ncbi:MAG: GCN5-related N-acetyltransferase [Glaciihabitans sp.]|nr:GCN5-related N-acetyltransferase [Glaciihabitans sp.]
MPDRVLDDPDFIPARERFWTTALADERDGQTRIAVAERDGSVIGIAMAGPPQDQDASWSAQLYVMYVLAAHLGSGAGPALLNAVVDPHQSAALWVADPNPRAQAFYRKQGFIPDGSSKTERGVAEIRMIRTFPGTSSSQDRSTD